MGFFSVALLFGSASRLLTPLPHPPTETQKENSLNLKSRTVETLKLGRSFAPPPSCLLVSLRVVCPPQLSPLCLPSPSTLSKAPDPAPRRPNIVNRKLSQTTSPTVQPPLSPLAAWAARVLSPTTDGEQPFLTGGGGGAGGGIGGDGGLSGVVQVATMNPQIVTQLSAEESR